MSDLQGQIALVTGASRGLGFACARAFGQAGAQVIAVARTVGGLEELDEAIRPGGGAATLVPLDIRDDEGLKRMGAAIFERWGHVDLWLHTAASAPPLGPAEHIFEKDFDQAVDVNIRAFQRLIRVVDPLLRRAEAPLALIAGDAPEEPRFWGSYAATKAAQAALTRSWAAEAARRITIARILPPAMPTALRARFFPGEDRGKLTPIDDVAARVLELASSRPPQPGESVRI